MKGIPATEQWTSVRCQKELPGEAIRMAQRSRVRVATELPVKPKMLSYPLRHCIFEQRGQ